MFERRILDLSIDEFFEIITPKIENFISITVEKVINDTDRKELRDRAVTVNELVKMKVVGARTRILSLLNKGYILRTKDGKIIYSSVQKYLTDKKAEDEKDTKGAK